MKKKKLKKMINKFALVDDIQHLHERIDALEKIKVDPEAASNRILREKIRLIDKRTKSLDNVKVQMTLDKTKELDNKINLLKSIALIEYNPVGEERREFARLTSISGLCLGKGESACMTYARFHNNVVGSSNLKDIKDYCSEHGVAYPTTCDFLYYAFKHRLMTKEEIGAFVQKVRSAGSILPDMDIDSYYCSVF